MVFEGKVKMYYEDFIGFFSVRIFFFFYFVFMKY